MRFGSVCSGIEAASVAFGPLGWEAAWFSEIEAFPRRVLAHHYPHVPNWGDMRGLAALIRLGLIEAPDVLVGGTPCQAFSVAGLRQSLNDDRGNLTLEFVRIADAIDDRRSAPCTLLWENVPGVLSTKDNAFGAFLAGLVGEDVPLDPGAPSWANAGVAIGPKRTAAWRVLDAQYFGLAQRRRRVFVVASARQGFSPASVLFEFQGVRRDFAPRRSPGESVAPAVTGGAAFGGNNTSGPIEVAAGLQRGDRGGFESETFVTHSLRGEGFDASEDGTGRGTPLVAVGVDYQNCLLQGDISGTLDAGQAKGNRGQGVLAFDTTQITSVANRSNPRAGDPCHLLAAGAHPPAVAFEPRYFLRDNKTGGAPSDVVALSATNAQRAGDSAPTVATAARVRRLTPRECERLQGFPDDYTAIPGAKDGPRYKALGNSWPVPVVRWIASRF